MGNKGKRATYRCSPPLPFQGNKAIGRLKFIEIVKSIFNGENKIFVDLFGGSFYLSYLIHMIHPTAKVICNDFDNYLTRLKNISSTRELLKKIKEVVEEGRYKKISDETKAKIDDIIQNHEGYKDIITLSSNLLYSTVPITDINDFLSHEYYNLLVKSDYDPNIEDYINGIEFRSCDWRDLFEEFKIQENVVFIVDPPSLLDKKDKWDVAENLKVLEVLKTKEYIYYCTGKPNILDFIKYLRDEAKYIDDFEVASYRKIQSNTRPLNGEVMIYKLDMLNESPNESINESTIDIGKEFDSVVIHDEVKSENVKSEVIEETSKKTKAKRLPKKITKKRNSKKCKFLDNLNIYEEKVEEQKEEEDSIQLEEE